MKTHRDTGQRHSGNTEEEESRIRGTGTYCTLEKRFGGVTGKEGKAFQPNGAAPPARPLPLPRLPWVPGAAAGMGSGPVALRASGSDACGSRSALRETWGERGGGTAAVASGFAWFRLRAESQAPRYGSDRGLARTLDRGLRHLDMAQIGPRYGPDRA